MTDKPVLMAELSDYSLRVSYNDSVMLEIAVHADGENLQVAAPGFDEIDWVDTIIGAPQITIKGRKIGPAPVLQPVQEEEDEHLPAAAPLAPTLVTSGLAPGGSCREGSTLKIDRRPQSVRMARRMVTNSSGGTKGGLTETERDDLLEKILDSLAKHERQTSAFTSAESHRIAKEVFGEDNHHNVMRVAGVRAALARGVYDNMSRDDLVAQRQRELLRERGHDAQLGSA